MDLHLSRLLRKKSVYLFMVFWAAVLGCAPVNVPAMPVESGTSSAVRFSQRQADLVRVSSFLEQEAVRQKLAETGLGESEIQHCLSRLDAEQLHRLALRVDKIKAGADGTWLLALLFVALIFVAILYFSDYYIRIEPRPQESG